MKYIKVFKCNSCEYPCEVNIIDLDKDVKPKCCIHGFDECKWELIAISEVE